MPTDELPDDDELTESIKILATDDKKIKSFGEIFTNDSSREILQLLFNEELSATQIAQKSNVSLQLAKYHLSKLQDLGVVKISRIDKNSKSQDMKIYTASKFSIVIVPPKLSEKTRESKLLARSFRQIYKVIGLGIATGFSGLLSLSQFQSDEQILVDDFTSGNDISLIEDSAQNFESSKSFSSIDSKESFSAAAPTVAESEPQMDFKGAADLKEESLEVINTILSFDELITAELLLPLVIITAMLGGLTLYYLYKFFKEPGSVTSLSSKSN